MDTLTVADLKALAKQHTVSLKGMTKKAEYVQALRAADVPSPVPDNGQAEPAEEPKAAPAAASDDAASDVGAPSDAGSNHSSNAGSNQSSNISDRMTAKELKMLMTKHNLSFKSKDKKADLVQALLAAGVDVEAEAPPPKAPKAAAVPPKAAAVPKTAAAPKAKEPTVVELRAQLKAKGVRIPAKANKAALVELLAAPAAAQPKAAKAPTVAELKAQLKAKSVQVPAGAKKADLEALVAAQPAAAAVPQGAVVGTVKEMKEELARRNIPVPSKGKKADLAALLAAAAPAEVLAEGMRVRVHITGAQMDDETEEYLGVEGFVVGSRGKVSAFLPSDELDEAGLDFESINGTEVECYVLVVVAEDNIVVSLQPVDA